MTFLDNDLFLTQLVKLFEKTKPTSKKKVYLTMKRYTWESLKTKKERKETEKSNASDKQSVKEELQKEVDDKEYSCLVRAVYGNFKISTLVSPSDTDKFITGYSNILKVHMDSMKKKERKKEKLKAKKIQKVKATIA
ncbi:signal recognition particle, SRP9/SRP14 subunit [Rhizophagus irregularis]|uniref:Signal recognition particle subunit SRP14 n=1 Tax=Rhizophagus irregularis TaxID=588596 RepID=A0A2I1HHT0_9GLOM|nr:signal recognition particle, SRP9/SRP14 subunit [Rhizophagus irregularis]PKK76449.1 signal recognition particle, SRP9/SRP14 subunit [Rhizophagus irregularis]PKY32272.1 signal recognition particle, SRP9/SRP14 subunit [Rhizophagus irregularis]PKY58436.1 signal recognition particle, SRP9/SRP14 subunit [Rhizophagus irregularis]CAB4401660.1 unnamed protein product [Rhizophagus irregularis]